MITDINFYLVNGDDFYLVNGDNFVLVEKGEVSQQVIDLVEYYKDLLIIQYNGKDKARGTIGAFVEPAFADGLIFDIEGAYDINTAVGVQLEILGKYIGVANDLIGTTTKLNDDDYRFLLKLKIILNNSNFSHKSIDDAIFKFFGTSLIARTNDNMIMDYFFDGINIDIIKVARDKGLLPKPMGVGLNWLIPFDDYFGFITYDEVDNPPSDKIGFTNYANYDIDEGNFLTFNELE